MGTGNFKQPPKGPEIGPTREYSELSEQKKAELGDMAKVAKDTIFKPAPLDPRLAEAEKSLMDEDVTASRGSWRPRAGGG